MHPLLQLPALMLVVTDVGVRPAGGFVMVIVMDAVAPEMNCGLRPPRTDAGAWAGMTIVNCGVT